MGVPAANKCTVDSVTTHTPRDRPRGMAYGRVWVLIEAGSTENELWKYKIVCVFTEYGCGLLQSRL